MAARQWSKHNYFARHPRPWVRVPFACTLTGWELTADASTTLSIDVWKDTYANFPPTVADTITNGNDPALSASNKAQDTDISDWSDVTIDAGDYIKIDADVASGNTATLVVLELLYTK